MIFEKFYVPYKDAVALGSADKAIILEFVRWSAGFKRQQYRESDSKYFFDGHWWCQDSYEAWLERLPWLSLKTIERHLLDLCHRGFLIKKTAGTATRGRVPNFYRAAVEEDLSGDLKRQVVQKPETLNVKMTDIIERQNDGQLNVKMTVISSTKNHNYESTERERGKTSPTVVKLSPDKSAFGASLSLYDTDTEQSDEELAPVFTNFEAVGAYLDPSRVSSNLRDLMSECSVNITELINLSKEWMLYHVEAKTRIPAPLSNFRSWVKREHRSKGSNSESKRSADKHKPFISTDTDWDSFDENKPWL